MTRGEKNFNRGMPEQDAGQTVADDGSGTVAQALGPRQTVGSQAQQDHGDQHPQDIGKDGPNQNKAPDLLAGRESRIPAAVLKIEAQQSALDEIA